MTDAPVLTSSAGFLSLLEEPDESLKLHALQQLNCLVDRFWAEIATDLPKIESLYEDESFPYRSLAAIVASKVFYHLEELDDAVKYALGAAELFDVQSQNEYVDTLIAKCIDDYVNLRGSQFEAKNEDEYKIDDRLVKIVERMFDRCYHDGQYKQALGIALESRRLDHIHKAITQSGDVKEMLRYAYCCSQRLLMTRTFRTSLLQTLIGIYRSLPSADYPSMAQCLLFLNDHQTVAQLLQSLISKGQDEVLMAYQVAFDLTENQNQPFLNQVIAALPTVDNTSNADMNSSEEKTVDVSNSNYCDDLARLKSILRGDISTDLQLLFQYQNNHADINILRQIKEKLEVRNPVTHNATVISHALMYCGTTVDTFLRENLEWLGKAQNWAKFTATASIGVIHKGHLKESMKLLEPYLPSSAPTSSASAASSSSSPYQEGGALYALGLIHANRGDQEKIDYLLKALRSTGNNEIIQHGACLGLGLSAMATQHSEVLDTLNTIIQQENAVAGEAAAFAMGLVLLGSNNGEYIDMMLSYAHESQHEKIIRALAMGIAFAVYARQEEADGVIEQMLQDQDHIIRYGAMYAIAFAYVATSNNSSIKRLLHVAVSDVNDDVRRAAVIALGFVLCNSPQQVPRVVALLSESYNPHVRYGSAIALGIACAASANKEALELLEPLCQDRTDFVRQAGFIAMSMVLMQVSHQQQSKVSWLRNQIQEVLVSKGDTMTKFGAVLGAGILDAGGRNMAISLLSPSSHIRMAAVVGTAMFTHFWYWYPYVHFVSLAFSPTVLMGINKNMEMPKNFQFLCHTSASAFAYPPVISLKVEEKKKKVQSATLSVTAKAKARAKKKEQENGLAHLTQSMDVEDTKAKANDHAEEGKESKKEEDSEMDAATHSLSNPCRCTLLQYKHVTVAPDQRYVPIKDQLFGVVMLADTHPDEPEELVVQNAPKVGIPGIDPNEPEPPKPFEFSG